MITTMTTTALVRFLRRTASGCAVIALATFGLAACSDDGPTLGDSADTTSPVGTGFKPALPAAANAMPYTYGATVGLGTWKVRVTDTIDPFTPDAGSESSVPEGKRYVALEASIENGALEEQAIVDDAFMMYDDRGAGSLPVALDAPPLDLPIESAASVTARLVFAIDVDAAPAYLVFLGSSIYGGRALDGVFSLDPNFNPEAPD